MNIFKDKINLCVLLSLAMSVGSTTGFAESVNIVERDTFSTTSKIDEWFTEVEAYDFDSSAFSFVLAGSTSCIAHVYLNGDKIGKFIPENSAGNPNTETAYFNFGRMIGYTKPFQRSIPVVLGQRGAQKFKQMIVNGRVNRHQRANCDYLIRKINNSTTLEGAYKDKASGSTTDISDYYSGSGLDLRKAIPRFLKQGNSRATDAEMSHDSSRVSTVYKSTEKKLAKQLWHILVADVLFSQFDRWSGQNFTVRTKPDTGSVRFYAKDNGGTYLIPRYTTRNLWAINNNWFNRYDRDTMDVLVEMHTFLHDHTGSVNFHGFTNREAFAKALGLRFTNTNGPTANATSIEDQWRVLRDNLDRLIEKYRADVRRGGQDAYL